MRASLDNLPSRATSTVLAAFLEHASPMAVFELYCDGQRKAVGLKLTSHCSNPVFYRQALTDRTELRELDRAHPVLRRLDNLVTYHWRSPGFLDRLP